MKKISTDTMTFKYLFALGLLAVLSIASYFILSENIKTQKTGAAVVNISGRQRMLSQRIALQAHQLADTQNREIQEKHRLALSDTIKIMEESHNGLIKGRADLNLPGNPSQQVLDIFYSPPVSLDSRLRNYLNEAKAIAGDPYEELSPDNPHLHYLSERSHDLLNAMEILVTQYQIESESDVRKLQQLALYVLGIALFVLLMLALFIFRPMVRHIEQETDELAKANEKLLELDHLKSMFIASMSHELRTPLNSILGFTGIILEGMTGEINLQQRDQLQRVYRSARHLLDLISDIINISKIEAGRMEIIIEDFSLIKLLNEVIDSMQTQIKEKGLALKVSLPADIQMHTDRKRLLECVLNLLSNAVKYTESGSINVAAGERSGMVEIAVSDTGIGISRKDLPNIFDAFERLESHLRIKSGGTGLGLYLTKKITTEILGGIISVESKTGRGSTFLLKVPENIKQTELNEEKEESGSE